MDVVAPLSELELAEVKALEPGTFFLLDGMLHVRVHTDDARIVSSIVKLDDFSLRHNVNRSDAVVLPVGALHLQVDAAQECTERYVAGVVHVTAEGPRLIVGMLRFGQIPEIVYLSLRSWTVSSIHTSDEVAFCRWSLLSREGTRDTVLVSRED